MAPGARLRNRTELEIGVHPTDPCEPRVEMRGPAGWEHVERRSVADTPCTIGRQPLPAGRTLPDRLRVSMLFQPGVYRLTRTVWVPLDARDSTIVVSDEFVVLAAAPPGP